MSPTLTHTAMPSRLFHSPTICCRSSQKPVRHVSNTLIVHLFGGFESCPTKCTWLCYTANVKRVLLTNDDGYRAAGFFPLLDELKKHYDVTAIAPSIQNSWKGKSITFGPNITAEKVQHEGHEVYKVTGTPADCVQLGLYNLMQSRPDYVVSGINDGDNIGHSSILGSGTIGAAMEGAIDGIVSVAVSLCDTRGRNIDYADSNNYSYFENAAKITAKLLAIMEDIKLPEGIDVISINIPFDADMNTEFEVTVPMIQPHGQVFEGEGKSFRNLSPPPIFENLKDGTDIKAIYDGKIAITPIDLRLSTSEAVSFLDDQLKKRW